MLPILIQTSKWYGVIIRQTMKTKNALSDNLKKFGNFFRKLVKAIVSGIPSEKIYTNPGGKSRIPINKLNVKSDIEKHYHKPVSKPVVEKQTLLKEKKKEKVHL